MVKAKKYIYQKRFESFPKETDVKIVEEELPPLKTGEFLTETLYLSIDPYMRVYAKMLPVGQTILGAQVAKIIQSKNPKYPIGKCIVAELGWRTHTISNGRAMVTRFPDAWIIPDLGNLPLSLALGVIGVSGITAYFGVLEICKPKRGETVVVTAAAGATGNVAGQIFKIHGCKVIGIAGSEEKGRWLTKDLGFDAFINYKDKDFDKKLTANAPNGVDCFFDNVGGEISSIIISKMNSFGRVALCGAISEYNYQETIKVTPIQIQIIMKELKVEGFIVHRWNDRMMEAVNQNLQWVKEGKLKYRETITNGFENTFKAFQNMLQGANIGKTIVKL